MRILVLNWLDPENPAAGGAEIHLREVFRRIVTLGHAVDLLCSSWPGAPPRATVDGIQAHRVGTRNTYPFLARGYFARHLAANQYDVVVEDLNKIPLYTPFWGAKKLVAIVHHLFGATVFQEAALPLGAAVWLAERPLGLLYRDTPFQAVSESTAEDLVERGIPRDSIRVVYNGVDSDILTPNPADRSSGPVFVYLGRLKKYKRVEMVIRAFAGLVAPRATLEIAGIGDYRASLERLVESLDLANSVKFLGFVPEADKPRLLRRAWASVLASPKEGWGISNLEAAACGTPVIATNSPGVRESVLDGKTGFLVPPEDTRAMTAAMRRLAESPALVNELGVNARRFAEGFTWERAAADTLGHLEEVVAAPAGRNNPRAKR
ncbi:MAG TPA: glycosyltransferase family 4 protein [Gemmatimonadaceae bacterium]|nr:glycosyltransferase family 4 protein [Gemmatimonadaceae bacterium]